MEKTSGHELLDSLAATRNLFGQLSKLMTSVDVGVSQDNWEVVSGNGCSYLTSALQSPNRWMPETLYRFYEMDGKNTKVATEDLVLFFGVLLDRKYSGGGFTEPWVTFGMYQMYSEGDGVGYNASWVEEPLSEGDRVPDGEFQSWKNSSGDPGENRNILFQSIAALPLVEIDSESTLQDRIITPLLAIARELIKQISPST